jgi:hypothetical protein
MDPSPDGSLYPLYRAAFHTLQGRLEWLERSRSFVGHPQGSEMDEACEASFRNFDMARAGLGGTNRLLAALNELYMVEACLAGARVFLYPRVGWASNPKAVIDSMNRAYAKYETARLGLKQAQAFLMAGRRNVIWWKLFFLLTAQYHSDRLLLGQAMILAAMNNRTLTAGTGRRFGGESRRPDYTSLRPVQPSEFLRRLRRGYSAVRSALDYAIPNQRKDGPTSAWLRRVWFEMTCCSHTVGPWLCDEVGRMVEFRSETRLAPQHRSDCDIADYILAFLEMQNVQARLIGWKQRPTLESAAWWRKFKDILKTSGPSRPTAPGWRPSIALDPTKDKHYEPLKVRLQTLTAAAKL